MPNISQQIQDINEKIKEKFDYDTAQQIIEEYNRKKIEIENKILDSNLRKSNETENGLIILKAQLEHQIDSLKSHQELLIKKKILEDIKSKEVPTLESGDCHFNSLALAFSAEILSPTGILANLNDDQADQQFAEFLQAFGNFHTDIKPKPPKWSTFKALLKHYAGEPPYDSNSPYQIERLLAPVFRKYYVEKVLPNEENSLKAQFANEIKQIQIFREQHEETISTLFENILNNKDYQELEVEDRSQIPTSFIIDSIRKEKIITNLTDKNFYYVSKKYPAQIDIKDLITALDARREYNELLKKDENQNDIQQAKLKAENAYNKMVTNLCIQASKYSNEFTPLVNENGKFIISENLDKLNNLDDLWNDQNNHGIWDSYKKRLSKPRATHDDVMKKIAGKLLNADLISKEYNQVQKEDDPFAQPSNPQHSYTIRALGQGAHWVPLIQDKTLAQQWRRQGYETAYSSNKIQDLEKLYESNGIDILEISSNDIQQISDSIRNTMIENATFATNITNIPAYKQDRLRLLKINSDFSLFLSELNGIDMNLNKLIEIKQKYKDANKGEKLAIFSVNGMLEIAQNKGRATDLLGLKIHDYVRIEFKR
ncbi:MAG: SAM-dependent chlorinase/fluorinase [Legionellales bacterium]|nr:SAM-dependent chlorinase/fluorinase [Legionellales bacterium]